MFGAGSDFSRGERNFTIGQSPKFWGNCSKICIKINKKLKKFEKKCKFFRKYFNFRAGHKFLIIGKIKNLNGHAIMGGAQWAEPPEGRKILRKFVEIGNVKFINFTKIG